MLTPLQFNQLCTAAWFGAPVIVQANMETCALVGGTVSTFYRVYFTLGVPGGAVFHSGGLTNQGSPFAAVLAAIDHAWEQGHLTGIQVEKAQLVVAAAEAVFCGIPTPPTAPTPVVCATCGESADFFGECGCAYVQVPKTNYFASAA